MRISIQDEKLGTQSKRWDDDALCAKAVGVATLSYVTIRGSATRLRDRLTLPSVFKAAKAEPAEYITDTPLDRELET